MQYLGGKSRIANQISDIIVKNKGKRSTYIELFLGGASVFEKTAPFFANSVASDTMPDLMLLWQAARDGWIPPTIVTEADYAARRLEAPSPLRGFTGFPCSFGGKWFGGYARDPKNGRNFAESASRTVIRKARTMSNTVLKIQNYSDITLDDPADTVIYCDPPYANTTTYAGCEPFDSELFWSTAAKWTCAGAQVYVSEYSAPVNWECIFTVTPRTTLARTVKSTATENLYTWGGV